MNTSEPTALVYLSENLWHRILSFLSIGDLNTVDLISKGFRGISQRYKDSLPLFKAVREASEPDRYTPKPRDSLFLDYLYDRCCVEHPMNVCLRVIPEESVPVWYLEMFYQPFMEALGFLNLCVLKNRIGRIQVPNMNPAKHHSFYAWVSVCYERYYKHLLTMSVYSSFAYTPRLFLRFQLRYGCLCDGCASNGETVCFASNGHISEFDRVIEKDFLQSKLLLDDPPGFLLEFVNNVHERDCSPMIDNYMYILLFYRPHVTPSDDEIQRLVNCILTCRPAIFQHFSKEQSSIKYAAFLRELKTSKRPQYDVKKFFSQDALPSCRQERNNEDELRVIDFNPEENPYPILIDMLIDVLDINELNQMLIAFKESLLFQQSLWEFVRGTLFFFGIGYNYKTRTCMLWESVFMLLLQHHVPQNLVQRGMQVPSVLFFGDPGEELLDATFKENYMRIVRTEAPQRPEDRKFRAF